MLHVTRICYVKGIIAVFRNMQLSIHDGLAHKNVFHGIPASTTMLIYDGTSDD